MATEIPIEIFSNPKHEWHAKNDPVMGGESTSTVTIDTDSGVGIFDGEVVNVPFLDAPGFITMETKAGRSGKGWIKRLLPKAGDFPDVSSCSALQMVMTSTTPEYKGYRVSFGNVHVPGGRYAYGYKANFKAPNGEGTVTIPFNQFSAKWDDATGDQIVTCAENPKYCPDDETLKSMQTFALWGEGVAGNLHIELKSISAVDCSGNGVVVLDTAAHNTRSAAETVVEQQVRDGSNATDSFLHPIGVVAFVAFVALFGTKLIRRKRKDGAYNKVLP
mmetsp:Transcript_53251/g.64152  ORF Transcript_53251/g.64152 Transcript_53251/m.64152 type:complete len:275 (-) Transcript_53251:475-1299(-)